MIFEKIIGATSWFGIESPFSSSLTTGDAVVNRVFQIINVIGGVAALIAVLFIIYGGFLYITSAGDDEKVKQAQGTITGSVIGLAIVFLARLIIGFVLSLVM